MNFISRILELIFFFQLFFKILKIFHEKSMETYDNNPIKQFLVLSLVFGLKNSFLIRLVITFSFIYVSLVLYFERVLDFSFFL